jgi:hypothetical protein
MARPSERDFFRAFSLHNVENLAQHLGPSSKYVKGVSDNFSNFFSAKIF